MATPTNIVEQLERDEGIRYSVYQDSLGYWTIGIGTCIDARKGCQLTRNEIEMLCTNRIGLASSALDQEWPWMQTIDPVRKGAFVNMAYQMGVDGLGAFRNMLADASVGNWQGASDSGLDSKWAKQQSPARASRLMLQLKNGIWQ